MTSLVSAKNARTVLMLVSAVYSLVSAKADTVPADHLNLDALPNFNYAGQDEIHKKSPCTLMFSALQKDRWSNALTQDISVETKNYPDFSYRLRFNLPRGLRALAPGMRTDNVVSYELSVSPSTSMSRGSSSMKLKIQALASNPSQIQEFTLLDTSTATGTPMTLIICHKIESKAR